MHHNEVSMYKLKCPKIIKSGLVIWVLILSQSLNAHQVPQVPQSTFQLQSQQCQVALESSVTISPNFIKVFSGDQVYYHIDQDGELTINGDHKLDLTPEQQALAAQFGQSLRETVPQTLHLIEEAMDLASVSVSSTFEHIFEQDNDLGEQISELIQQAKQQLKQRFQQQEDHITLNQQNLDNMDDLFSEEFTQQVQALTMKSMGSLFNMIGDALSDEQGDLQSRLQAFTQRMEKMGKKLEEALSTQSQQIHNQTKQLCQQIITLDDIESQLQQQIPQISQYNLIKVD